MIRPTIRLAAVLPLLAACASAPAPVPASSAAAASPPTLVVFFMVDQMRADYYDRWKGQLSGGLARLYEGGAVFTNAHQDHAITETAPGHSTPLSGRFPAHNGIVQNSAGVNGPESHLVDANDPGATPLRFRGTALFDWMVAKDPRTRVLSVSRKDRGAILPVGRAKAPVFWFAPSGSWTTSTYYATTLPDWVKTFNATQPAGRYAGRTWDLLLPPSAYPERDTVPQENRGRNVAFPHPLSPDPAFAARQLPNFPFMDEYTLAFALQGVQEYQLGTGPQADLLAISLSSTDAVGHAYGPDSREVHDQIVRLDRALGVFLDSLFRMRDSSRVIIALSADHGVSSIPGIRSHYDGDTRSGVLGVFWDSTRAFGERLRRAGIDSGAVILDVPYLILDRAKFAGTKVNADSVARDFIRAVKADPGVMRADLMRDIRRADPERDKIARRWQHMIPESLPVDVVITLRPFWAWQGSYISHGLPHEHDTNVPVLFYGAPFKPGRYDGFTRTVDVAPTLAHVLGVRPLEKLDGRVLPAALR